MRDWLAPSAETQVENRLKMCFIRGLIDGILFGMIQSNALFADCKLKARIFVCFSLFCHPRPGPVFSLNMDCLFVYFVLFPSGFSCACFFFRLLFICLFVSKSSCASPLYKNKSKSSSH